MISVHRTRIGAGAKSEDEARLPGSWVVREQLTSGHVFSDEGAASVNATVVDRKGPLPGQHRPGKGPRSSSRFTAPDPRTAILAGKETLAGQPGPVTSAASV
jgi:hypothetical protein